MARRIRRARYGPTTVRQQNTQMSQYRAMRSGYVPPPTVFPSIYLTDWNGTPVSTTSANGNNISSMYISPNGEDMYLADESTDKIYQYSLSTPFDPSTLAYVQDNTMVAISRLYGMTMSPDGLKLFTGDITSDILEEWHMTEAWNIVSIVETPDVVIDADTMTDDGNINGLSWSDDGSKIFIMHNTGIASIACSSPWDLSTADTPHKQTVTDSGSADIHISLDGLMLYLMWGTNPGKVRHVRLTVPFDLSTAQAAIIPSEDFVTDAGNVSPIAFFYFEERGELWIHDDNEIRVYKA